MVFRFKRHMRRFLLITLLSIGMLLLTGPVSAYAMPADADKGGSAILRTAPNGDITSTTAATEPIIKLTEYQKRWIADKSRFKIGMFSRQAGKSFAASLEAVIDCYENARAKWVFLSAGERQSRELMSIAAMHARAIGAAIMEQEGYTEKDKDGNEYKQLEIVFENGSRIVGLPANPSTARGHSANILLDEFAFHKDSRSIWKALFPTVTRGWRVVIISTPQGKQNKFYELWTGATNRIWDGSELTEVGERGGYSKHKVTIEQAVKMGLELKNEEGRACEPEDLRLALGDDEAWQQEYMVEFVDEATAFLTYELIAGVEEQRLLAGPSWVQALIAAATDHHDRYKSLEAPPAFDAGAVISGVPFTGDMYLGMDIGRKRHLSVIWMDELVDGAYWTRAVIELRAQPFGVQRNVLHALMRVPSVRRCCIDNTGIGAQLAEQAVEKFGARVEPVTFNLQSKEALATGLKTSFEDRRDRIPVDQTIRQSLHSVRKIVTASNNARYDADATDRTGHADHFWAKALAVEARSKTGGKPAYTGVGKREAKFGRGAW